MKEAKRGRPTASDKNADRLVLVGLRGTREYFDWFHAASQKTGIPKAGIARQALKLWAEVHGIPEPPVN